MPKLSSAKAMKGKMLAPRAVLKIGLGSLALWAVETEALALSSQTSPSSLSSLETSHHAAHNHQAPTAEAAIPATATAAIFTTSSPSTTSPPSGSLQPETTNAIDIIATVCWAEGLGGCRTIARVSGFPLLLPRATGSAGDGYVKRDVMGDDGGARGDKGVGDGKEDAMAGDADSAATGKMAGEESSMVHDDEESDGMSYPEALDDRHGDTGPSRAVETQTSTSALVESATTGAGGASDHASSTGTGGLQSTTSSISAGDRPKDDADDKYNMIEDKPHQPHAFTQLQDHVPCMAGCIEHFGPKCGNDMLDCICNHLRSSAMQGLINCVKVSCHPPFLSDPFIAKQNYEIEKQNYLAPNDDLRDTEKAALHKTQQQVDDYAAAGTNDGPDSNLVRRLQAEKPSHGHEYESPLHTGLALVLKQKAAECWKAGYFGPRPKDIGKRDARAVSTTEPANEHDDTPAKMVGSGGWGNDRQAHPRDLRQDAGESHMVRSLDSHHIANRRPPPDTPTHFTSGGVGSGGTGRTKQHPQDHHPRSWYTRSTQSLHHPIPVWQLLSMSIFLLLTALLALGLVVSDMRSRFLAQVTATENNRNTLCSMALHGTGDLRGRKWIIKRLSGRRSWVIEEAKYAHGAQDGAVMGIRGGDGGGVEDEEKAERAVSSVYSNHEVLSYLNAVLAGEGRGGSESGGSAGGEGNKG